METSRYYTPSLEEFHVGFEFEYKDPHYEGREEFRPCIIKDAQTVKFTTNLDQIDGFNEIDHEHLLSNIEYGIEHGDIRIKYLGREDIESFGFIYGYKKDHDILDTDNHSCNSYQCILRNVDFCNSSRGIDLKMTYLGTENNPCVYRLEMYERNYFEWFPIFEGNIKNKSELKRILKMIGVIG